MIVTDVKYFSKKPYQFVLGMDLNNEEKLGIKIKSLTDKDDLFVVPMEFTGFKYYSERSEFIDFKSVVHRRKALKEWYNRITKTYRIDILDRRTKQNIYHIAEERYRKMGQDQMKYFVNQGVDYLVQYDDVAIDIPVLLTQYGYTVYDLRGIPKQ